MTTLSKSASDFIEHRKGGLLPPGTRVTTYVDTFDAKRIRAIRGKMSQEDFARRLMVSLSTYRKWEQGQRRPEGPGRALLILAENDRDFVFGTLEAAQGTTVRKASEHVVGSDGKKPRRKTAAKPGKAAAKRAKRRTATPAKSAGKDLHAA